LFNFFKKDKENNRPQDVKTVRDSLLQFIKEQLGRVEGGEGSNIKGLQLFLAPKDEEKHIYESAVYYEQEDRFKNEEVQKIADDYAIALPQNWTMEIKFTESLPTEAIKAADTEGALLIITRKQAAVQKAATAYIKVINGQAEKEQYTITSASGKITIGREKKVQTADGFFRINTITFPASSSNESNKFISRQHAHIEYDMDTGGFLLFADEGGVPPRNKIKVLSPQKEAPVKIYTTQIGHYLQEGDQIILGESALLQFSYSPTED
jgi:hypothetical protein